MIEAVIPAIGIFDRITIVYMQIDIEKSPFYAEIKAKVIVLCSPVAARRPDRSRQGNSQAQGKPFVRNTESEHKAHVIFVLQLCDRFGKRVHHFERRRAETQVGIQNDLFLVTNIRKRVILRKGKQRRCQEQQQDAIS